VFLIYSTIPYKGVLVFSKVSHYLLDLTVRNLILNVTSAKPNRFFLSLSFLTNTSSVIEK